MTCGHVSPSIGNDHVAKPAVMDSYKVMDEDSVLVRLSVLRPSNTDIRERRILLTESNPTAGLGRSSTRLALNLQPTITNGCFDSPVMSRNHALLEADFSKETVTIHDQRSMHGTFLNQKKIPKGASAVIRSGDVVVLGAPVFRQQEEFQPANVRVNGLDFHKPSPTPVSTGPNHPRHTNTFVVPEDCEECEDCEGYSDDEVTDEAMTELMGANPSAVIGITCSGMDSSTPALTSHKDSSFVPRNHPPVTSTELSQNDEVDAGAADCIPQSDVEAPHSGRSPQGRLSSPFGSLGPYATFESDSEGGDFAGDSHGDSDLDDTSLDGHDDDTRLSSDSDSEDMIDLTDDNSVEGDTVELFYADSLAGGTIDLTDDNSLAGDTDDPSPFDDSESDGGSLSGEVDDTDSDSDELQQTQGQGPRDTAPIKDVTAVQPQDPMAPVNMRPCPPLPVSDGAVLPLPSGMPRMLRSHSPSDFVFSPNRREPAAAAEKVENTLPVETSASQASAGTEDVAQNLYKIVDIIGKTIGEAEAVQCKAVPAEVAPSGVLSSPYRIYSEYSSTPPAQANAPGNLSAMLKSGMHASSLAPLAQQSGKKEFFEAWDVNKNTVARNACLQRRHEPSNLWNLGFHADKTPSSPMPGYGYTSPSFPSLCLNPLYSGVTFRSGPESLMPLHESSCRAVAGERASEGSTGEKSSLAPVEDVAEDNSVKSSIKPSVKPTIKHDDAKGKRKAAEISYSFPDEEEWVENNLKVIQSSLPSPPTSPEELAHSEKRPAKKMKKIAEAVGYAALGGLSVGAAVLGSLIYTAPNFV